MSLTQWLAPTPPDIVSQLLKAPVEVVERLKKEKQVWCLYEQQSIQLAPPRDNLRAIPYMASCMDDQLPSI